MGVLMQAFYWDCPKVTNQQFNWWNYVRNEIPRLKAAGITALWLPPSCKAKDVMSMGYDPFDYYDLGDYLQKYHDRKETWFGSKDDLIGLIRTAHDSGIQVLADLVLNQCSGGELETNPLTGVEWYTNFEPASNRFRRNYECFHPSKYESDDGAVFEGYAKTDLCHRNPFVYGEILEYCRWLIEDIGYDGFRYDCAKGYGGWVIKSIQEYMYRYTSADKKYYKPFGVGELWEDSDQPIESWLDDVNYFSDNPASAFDFVLRNKLRNLCLDKRYSLKDLADWIRTQWKNTKFTPQAWRGTYDLTIPQTTYTDDNSYGAFWAPPRGYAVYIPE